MPLIQWAPKYSVNVREIDQQHQKLMALINELYDAMTAGHGKDVLSKVLGELINYTVYHFSFEEKLFDKHGYPETAAHKSEHEKLKATATDLKQKFDSGKGQITLEVMNFLKNWLNNHILGTDKKYTAFLNGKGVT
jgi:hemerythrin-like metal-binding protein